MLDWIKVAGKLAYDRPTRDRLLGYRPVVMCLIQSLERDAFLFVQPAAGRGAWMPPQEGIQPDASVESATVQCLDVELGIGRNQMHFRCSVWLGRKAIPENWFLNAAAAVISSFRSERCRAWRTMDR